jgi:hypothetical protein
MPRGFATVADSGIGTVAIIRTAPAPPAPPPAVSPPDMGMWSNPQYWEVLSWTQRHTNAEAMFGTFAGHWRQFKTDTNNGQLNTAEQTAIASGKRLFSNWKVAGTGTWAQTAAGDRDAIIIAAAQDWAPHCLTADTCWLTLHHEPENDILGAGSGMMAADYVAMWQHVAPLWRQHAPLVKLVWNMAGYEGNQPIYPSLYPGDEHVDYIGHDPYIDENDPPANLADKMITRTQWFRTNISAKPVIIAEWGTDLNGVRGTVQHRADAVAGVMAQLAEIRDAGVIELDYYNSREHYFECVDPENNCDPPNLGSADAQAFYDLKAATE